MPNKISKRSASAQSKHDIAVKKTVNYYKQRGYNVTADLKGFTKPQEIKGYIPDVIATKGIKRNIIEVETKKSNATDKEQQSAFRNFAKQRVNTTFIKKVV